MKLLMFLPAILGLVFSTVHCVKRFGPSGLLWPITFLCVPDYFFAKQRWALVVPLLILLSGIAVTLGLFALFGVES